MAESMQKWLNLEFKLDTGYEEPPEAAKVRRVWLDNITIEQCPNKSMGEDAIKNVID